MLVSNADNNVMLTYKDYLYFKKCILEYVKQFGLINYQIEVIFDDNQAITKGSCATTRFIHEAKIVQFFLNKFYLKKNLIPNKDIELQKIALHEVLHLFIQNSLNPYYFTDDDGHEFYKIKDTPEGAVGYNAFTHELIMTLINREFKSLEETNG